ncbi:phosphoribosylaminoimidazole carboxylase ade2 [Trichoglossum hirsutum]|uniref:Adenylosuccinate synthetase n=1 Tax=Trichoglossum hirsutum TaxID=265104 RepID=A0A9P8RSE9_9PEZI|nr:phosphoribosylaminoimidazole carboxylase ade2 [Trichoglossum hirsutum]
MATIVLGAQFGDEGKGKLVDILCETADVCARSAGGTNAGHTVVANGITHDFHMLPSGISSHLLTSTRPSPTCLVHPHCLNLIGSGVVVHAPSFFSELETAEKNGLSIAGRVFVSDRAHLVFDFHQLVDGLGEVELGAASIGTTRKGIGPTYAAKASRSGIRIAEIFDWPEFERKYRSLVHSYEKRFANFQYDVEEELERYKVYRERFRPYITDAVLFISKALKENKKVVVEGANALLLDIDYGTYPFVTSSSTSIGGAIAGLALSPFKIKEIIGVVKAYTTRVGSGPFPTELSGVRT